MQQEKCALNFKTNKGKIKKYKANEKKTKAKK